MECCAGFAFGSQLAVPIKFNSESFKKANAFGYSALCRFLKIGVLRWVFCQFSAGHSFNAPERLRKLCRET